MCVYVCGCVCEPFFCAFYLCPGIKSAAQIFTTLPFLQTRHDGNARREVKLVEREKTQTSGFGNCVALFTSPLCHYYPSSVGSRDIPLETSSPSFSSLSRTTSLVER